MSWRAQALEGLPRALAVKSFQSSRAFSTEKSTTAEQTEAPKKESAVVKSDNYDEYEDDFEEDNSARGQVRFTKRLMTYRCVSLTVPCCVLRIG